MRKPRPGDFQGCSDISLLIRWGAVTTTETTLSLALSNVPKPCLKSVTIKTCEKRLKFVAYKMNFTGELVFKDHYFRSPAVTGQGCLKLQH